MRLSAMPQQILQPIDVDNPTISARSWHEEDLISPNSDSARGGGGIDTPPVATISRGFRWNDEEKTKLQRAVDDVHVSKIILGSLLDS